MANQISSLDQLVWGYLKQKGFDRTVEALTTDLSEASLLTWDANENVNGEHTLEQVFNSFVESNGLSVAAPAQSKKDKKKKKKEKRKKEENTPVVAEPQKKKAKVETPQEDQTSQATTESAANGSDANKKKKKKKNKNKAKETPQQEEAQSEPAQENDDAMEQDDEFVIKKPNQTPTQQSNTNGSTPKNNKQNGSTPRSGNKLVFNDDDEAEEAPVPESSEKNETEGEVGSPSFGKKKNEPFRRIKEDDVVIADSRLKDNSYFAKKGDDYGRRANEDLMKVKGKGFRTAKTKKKKGTYKGGAIDVGVNSVKFEYSDEE